MKREEFIKKLEKVDDTLNDLLYDNDFYYNTPLYAYMLMAHNCLKYALSKTEQFGKGTR